MPQAKSTNKQAYKILPASSYPAIFITFDNALTTGNNNKLETIYNFTLYALSIKPAYEEAFQQISNITWNVNTNKGLIPLLMQNTALQIEDESVIIKPGNWKILRVTDKNQRHLCMLKFPITAHHWKTITDP